MKLITSFGPDGWDVYGRKFLKTYLDYWDLPITVYYEDWDQDFIRDDRIEYICLWTIPNLDQFLNRPEVAMTYGKAYTHDVSRFCRKSFAQIYEALRQSEPFFWIDADVETKRRAKTKKLTEYLDNVYMAYMGRQKFYSCTSFVGFDPSHEDNERFMAEYERMYLSGEYTTLKHWHDCMVLDAVREETGVPARNLSANNPKARSSYNVFDDCVPWAHHKKGNRKYA